VQPLYSFAAMVEYVYMLITREFKNSNENVYKIGRTENLRTRLYGYPKGSQYLLSLKVANSIYIEHQIMKTFKQKFKHRTDIGREYFEGSFPVMAQQFRDIVEPGWCEEISGQSSDGDLKNKKIPRQSFTCECGFSCARQFNLDRHKETKQHKLTISQLESQLVPYDGIYECQQCAFVTTRKGNYRQHLTSSKHKKSTEKNAKDHANKSEDAMYECQQCAFKTTRKGNYGQHLTSAKHIKNAEKKWKEDAIKNEDVTKNTVPAARAHFESANLLDVIDLFLKYQQQNHQDSLKILTTVCKSQCQGPS